MVLPQIRCVLTNRYNHCALVILAGLAGSYWAFVGLCALPLLVSKGLASGAAVWNVTGMMACYAVGAPVFGWIGDRLNRCGMTLSLACAGSVVCWGVLASGVALPAATLALVVYLLGFCCGAFHLVFALVMERNPVEHTGTAASYINIGTFLGAAVMQSLAAVLGSVAGAAACALPMAVASVLSLVLSASLWPVRERAQLKRRRRAFAVTKA
jgi:MFS family permease